MKFLPIISSRLGCCLLLFAAWVCSPHASAYSASADGPVYVNPANSPAAPAPPPGPSANAPAGHVTQTVYGFLDFTTTIGNTVMVFSPQSAPVAEAPKKATTPAPPQAIETRPPTAPSAAPSEIKPSKPTASINPAKSSPEKKKVAASSVVEVRVQSKEPEPAVTFLSSIVEVRSSGDETPTPAPPPPPPPPQPPVQIPVQPPVAPVTSPAPAQAPPPVQVPSPPAAPAIPTAPEGSNNLLGPEVYDFLSRQPAEVVDETFKVFDLKPSKRQEVHSEADGHISDTPLTTPLGLVASRIKGSGSNAFPTGLVTRMGGTVVREGVTTVHETSVIGTYISGKYAQVVQSTSHIFENPPPGPPAIRPSSSLRILKTAAPTAPGATINNNKVHLDPTPAGGSLVEETLLALPQDDALANTRPLRRSAVAARSDFLSRLHRSKAPALSEHDEGEEEEVVDVSPRPAPSSARRPSSRARPSQTVRPSFSGRFTNSRFGRSSSELATVSVFTDPPARAFSTASAVPGGRRFSSYRNRSGGSGSSSSSNNNNNNARSSSSVPSGSAAATTEPGYTRRGFKPRHSSPESSSNHNSGGNHNSPTAAPNSLYKFKLSRPAGRWQYKTSPKPRVTIRQQKTSDGDLTQTEEFDSQNALTPSHPGHATSPQPGPDEDELQEHGPATESLQGSADELLAAGAEDSPGATEALHLDAVPTIETIKVEISTPADFSDVYYEIATIKSPYTFQVGTLKNTRFITVTSTLEKSLASNEPEISPTEPLTENILATSTPPPFEVNQLPGDNNVATLPPILLPSDVETPALETFTETFNTTQLLMKTHLLPVVQQQGGSIATTRTMTLVQSYHITRFVTAIKTLPPTDAFQFLPSRSLNEFNSRLDEAGSELHELELSENEQEGEGEERRIFPPDIMGPGDLASVGVDFDVAAVERLQQQKQSISATPTTTAALAPPQTVASPPLSNEQLQQLALLRYLNPLAPAPAITTSRPVLRYETVYESHVIPVWNGLSTSYSTISRPVATISKTEYEIGTVAPAPTLPGLLGQQQFTITSTPVVVQTIVTQTESKILRLTFGAKTTFTTLFSTRVVPTVLTSYVTTSIPVQPTAQAFPGFFPGGFPAFPFVG